MHGFIWRRMAAVGMVGTVVSGASSALTFNITNGGGASPQMMSAFADAGGLWSTRFNDSITVNIRLNAASMSSGVLGHTDSFYDPYVYSDVRNALVTDRTSADDVSATNHLQAGAGFSMLINKTANNPNGALSATPYFDTGGGGPGQAGPENNQTVRMTSANAKALGLYPANSAGLDGIITFTNQNVFDYDRGNGINQAQLDFVGIAAHEIGHMLGFVSGVDTLAGNAVPPGKLDNELKFVTPIDLYRFSSRSIGAGSGLGVIDWAADGFTKYFSVDGGATALAEFSTGAVYEESHWKNDMGLGLMDPTAVGGELLAFSNNDLRAFDVIGYNRADVPEPICCAFPAIGALAGMRSSRRKE